jgi:hypothetical protein
MSNYQEKFLRYLLGSSLTIVACFTAFGNKPSLADSAIAINPSGTSLYYCVRANENMASSCALSYCQEHSGKQCNLWATSSTPGYAAVAESSTHRHWARGYSSQELANQAALNGCLARTSSNDVCQVTLKYLDVNNQPSNNPGGCINPATGLPMLFGECWGVDVGGNPYGMRNP